MLELDVKSYYLNGKLSKCVRVAREQCMQAAHLFCLHRVAANSGFNEKQQQLHIIRTRLASKCYTKLLNTNLVM